MRISNCHGDVVLVVFLSIFEEDFVSHVSVS